ncbi:TolC family protein [Catalinimonas niigatensis]|uniref:TolC family protein n=1 Tax=Catalinimonas niigatensis TaxID=1397264 RepID=UPI0026660154|nr:TolC family protein [Catalinimonas niigatensis]WPP52596.1 TolC family protein [Catalinimonas niigatensis]
MFNRSLISLILTFLSLPLWAQSPYVLNELLDKALKENLNIKIRYQGQDLFDEQVKEVKNNFLPTIDLNGTHQYYFDIPTQVAPASAFGGGEGGGYLPLSFGLPHQTNLSLQLQQVLYNPQLPVGIKAAQTGRDIAELQLHQTKEEVVYQVSSTYYNAQSVAERMKLLEQNIQSLERLIKITDLLRQNDLAKSTDVERLQLNQASLSNQIANLKVTYQQLLNHLRLLTNTPMTSPFAIDTHIDMEQEKNIPFIIADSVQRTDVALAQKQFEVQQLEEKQIQAGYLPSLYAVGVYGQSGFGELDEDYYEFFPMSYVGLQLSVPIFDGLSKKSQRSQKRIQQSQTQNQISLLEQQVQSEISNALASMQTQRRAVEIQQRALKLAEKVYQNMQLQYKEGISGVSDLIDSENELRQVQSDYLNAWVQLKLAELEIRHATGNLIE